MGKLLRAFQVGASNMQKITQQLKVRTLKELVSLFHTDKSVVVAELNRLFFRDSEKVNEAIEILEDGVNLLLYGPKEDEGLFNRKSGRRNLCMKP